MAAFSAAVALPADSLAALNFTNPVADTASLSPGTGKNAGFESAVLFLSGASCLEELPQDELERYQDLADHPLDLNLAGRALIRWTSISRAGRG